jgi:hypothetical protein
VLRYSPEGELKTPSSQVIITFSLPMIPVTSHQELQEMGSVEGVSISPFIDGSWKWYVTLGQVLAALSAKELSLDQLCRVCQAQCTYTGVRV